MMKPVTCGFLVVVTSIASIHLASCKTGVDVSNRVTQPTWKCLKKNGYTYAIVRIYQSNGKVDANAVKTIKDARKVGIKPVDGYIFPCPKCKANAKKQVQDAVANLRRNGAKVDQIWIDVEEKKYWNGNSASLNFIKQMVNAVKALKIPVGIYTSAYQWSQITGNSKQLGNIQLWYASWNNKPNFKDFVKFGGWTKPTMKQYAGNVKVCGVTIDKNWRP